MVHGGHEELWVATGTACLGGQFWRERFFTELLI
jgi:hypothetical protein